VQQLASPGTRHQDPPHRLLNKEKDEDLKSEARKSLQAIEGRLAWGERVGVAFTSVSLGSILLLAALGLAITYGLMGVINMAHGELIMIGAYTTYVVQNLFKKTVFFDWYSSLPCRGVPGRGRGRHDPGEDVIRWLYGRPLETLLSTWGISLILIQRCAPCLARRTCRSRIRVHVRGGRGDHRSRTAVESHRHHRLRRLRPGPDVPAAEQDRLGLSCAA